MQLVTEVGGRELNLNNLGKVFWPDQGLTKGDLLHYYLAVAPYLLPHLKDRPMVMQRFPDGIAGNSFYQKDCPEGAPPWLATVPIAGSRGQEAIINYILCDHEAALLWLVNLGCIEMHPWLSRLEDLDSPSFLVFDLDPNGKATMADVRDIALLLKEALEGYGLNGYAKLSGSTGMHIYVPVASGYTYQQIRAAALHLAQLVTDIYPAKATIERSVAKRGDRVYIDCLQNGKGKTIASVYSLRPGKGAPVSMPVGWEQIRKEPLQSDQYSIHQVPAMLKDQGDIFQPVLENKQRIDLLLSSLQN